jgi:hypothetical protein
VLLKIFELELLFSFFSCHTGSACTVDCGWQNARVCGQAIVSFCFGSRGLKQVRVSVLLFLAWRNGCVHIVWLSCLGCRKDGEVFGSGISSIETKGLYGLWVDVTSVNN